jgi:AraC-like DNA-binding protein
LRAAVGWAARGIAQCEFCDHVGTAERLVADRDAIVFFTYRYDIEGSLADELITRLRYARPHMPIVMVESAPSSAAAQVREGLPTADATVTEGSRHFRRDVSRLIASATHRARRHTMSVTLAGLVPPPVQAAAGSAIERGHRPRSVRQLAAAVGVPRKTLDRRLGKAIRLTARQLIGWGRLLAAAMCLENPSATVSAVTAELEFASPSALRNLLQRYAGLTPTQLRQRGGADHLFDRLRKEIERGTRKGERATR